MLDDLIMWSVIIVFGLMMLKFY